MPSLHAGGSFLFLYFAWRYGRVLLIPYAIIFAYLNITAIASLWHYAIDIPIGIALAAFCCWLAHRLAPSDARFEAPDSPDTDMLAEPTARPQAAAA